MLRFFDSIVDKVLTRAMSRNSKRWNSFRQRRFAARTETLEQRRVLTATIDNISVTSVDENDMALLVAQFTNPDTSDSHGVVVSWDDPNASADSTFTLPTTAGLTAGDSFSSLTDLAVLTITSREYDHRPSRDPSRAPVSG